MSSENVVTAVLADLSHRWAPLPGIQGHEPQQCADCQRVSYSEMDRAINGTQCPRRALQAVIHHRLALSELVAAVDRENAAHGLLPHTLPPLHAARLLLAGEETAG